MITPRIGTTPRQEPSEDYARIGTTPRRGPSEDYALDRNDS